jgi:hypothetical protein
MGGSLLREYFFEIIIFNFVCKYGVPNKYLGQGYLFREVAFGVNAPQTLPLPLLEASLEVPFREAVQHRLRLSLNFCNILESFSF